jgi:fatty-acyl-CoA synthase
MGGAPDEPIPETYPAALDRAARLWPDAEAFVMGDTRLSFAALAERVAGAASALAALGIARGDHVAICLGNGPEWVVLLHAVTAIGGVAVPINTRLKDDEIAYQLHQSDARFLFVCDRFLKVDFIAMMRRICPAIDRGLPDPALPRLETVVVLGADVPGGAVGWQDVIARGGAPVRPDVAPDDPALIQYTSGTTARPKGVLLTHRNMVLDAWYVAARIGVRPGDRYYSPRPFFHVAGTTLSILTALCGGACLLTTPRFAPGPVLKLISEERCTLLSGNDTLLLMLLGDPAFGDHEYCLRGGWAAASPSVMRQLVDRFGATETVIAYGLSEASPNCAMSDWRDPLEDRINGLAGPQPGVALRIADPATGADLPADSPGEILVRGWNVMQGYYNKPEETAAAIDADGWLHTGDLGTLSADGRLTFLGRLKEIIRVGGENLAPAEVEDCILAHPAVAQVQVVGAPDPRLVEVPVAYVVPREGVAVTSGEIIDWAKARLAGFKVPRHVRFLDGFEAVGMTASGKVQRDRLRERAPEDFGLGAGPAD